MKPMSGFIISLKKQKQTFHYIMNTKHSCVFDCQFLQIGEVTGWIRKKCVAYASSVACVLFRGFYYYVT